MRFVIKEALDYLAKLQTPKNPITVEVHGHPHAVKVDGTIGEPINKPDTSVEYPTLHVSTLAALVAAYKAIKPDTAAIHVSNTQTVLVIAIAPDEFGNRREYISAVHAAETPFPFNIFLDTEEFLIKFRSSFFFNDDAVKVQQLCSSVESGSSVSVADDGISQAVVISTGTINKAPVTLPAEGVPLIPWRTFRDAAPVESKFLLRMKTAKDAKPSIALFEIDQKWKLDTVQSIKKFLVEQLPDAAVIA
jgi:hypothetical protein